MARKKRRSSGRSAARRSTRRVSRRRGRSSARGGFALKELLMTGAVGAVGVMGVNKVLERVLPAGASPWMRIAATAGIAIGGGMLLRKFNPSLAKGVATGGVVAAGLLAVEQVRSGMSGMGGSSPMGILPMNTYNRGVGGLGDGDDGMGNYAANPNLQYAG